MRSALLALTLALAAPAFAQDIEPRTNVAEFHPSVVTVSDQALQLWPSRRFTEFHTTAMARATLDMLTYGRQIGHHEPSTDLWVHSALTMALLDVWRVQREHGDEFVTDIFRNFTFVPVVDNFLYSGQATFAQAYFRGSEDLMPRRVHPLYFSHMLPTGRRMELRSPRRGLALARFFASRSGDAASTHCCTAKRMRALVFGSACTLSAICISVRAFSR